MKVYKGLKWFAPCILVEAHSWASCRYQLAYPTGLVGPSTSGDGGNEQWSPCPFPHAQPSLSCLRGEGFGEGCERLWSGCKSEVYLNCRPFYTWKSMFAEMRLFLEVTTGPWDLLLSGRRVVRGQIWKKGWWEIFCCCLFLMSSSIH